MRIGVVCALEREIELIRQELSSALEHRAGGIVVSESTLFSHTLLLTISGIGKTCAAMTAEALITAFGCDLILNTGLAGGCDAGLKAGDAVLIEKAVYHDFDLGSLGGFDSFFDGFHPDMRLYGLAQQALTALDIRFIRGVVATGDVFVADSALKDSIVSRTSCSCVDMEAAAIAHVASANALPFVIVKFISDSADEGATADFETSLDTYSRRCAAFVREMARVL
ncbi:MAG: 5'-methylthioadenosine/adenosylhomocysteine nucleosidase [Oscillospiraceae bacterium]|nr:5'-methylthioadenosine/adenosylhomocysteine nucleosidase [Oscillospiraceae bacterium]